MFLAFVLQFCWGALSFGAFINFDYSFCTACVRLIAMSLVRVCANFACDRSGFFRICFGFVCLVGSVIWGCFGVYVAVPILCVRVRGALF